MVRHKDYLHVCRISKLVYEYYKCRIAGIIELFGEIDRLTS